MTNAAMTADTTMPIRRARVMPASPPALPGDDVVRRRVMVSGSGAICRGGMAALVGCAGAGYSMRVAEPDDLFGVAEPAAPPVPEINRPLADRLRPATLGDVVGQDHLLGPDGALTRMLARGSLASLILW